MSITIRDVAQKAQVGVGTVSRVLNDNPAVSDHTRKKVKNVITELGYTPNPNAQRLSSGKTWHIAVMLPHLTFPSYVERLRGVQHALANSEYDLVLYGIGSPKQRDKYFEKLLTKTRVDGLIIISLPPTESQANNFVESGIPTVLVDASHVKLPHVVVDDIAGGKFATQHLIDLGHHKIAFLSNQIETPYQQSSKDRYNGYRQALEDAYIPCEENYILTCGRRRQDAYATTKAFLRSNSSPTAIFVASDTQAIGVLDAAEELNIHVPNDLSIVGYDNIRDSEYVGLTTISQPLFNSGATGTNLLLEILSSKKDKRPIKHLLPIKLVKRRTTAPPNNSS